MQMWYMIEGALRGDRPRDVARRSTILATISFLTLIDLFGSQALLPQIIDAYGTTADIAGIAVNAATLGMAVASLAVAWYANRIDRKKGIWVCLALLSVPTACLAFTESIWVFLSLRIVQGMFMAAAFTLTMTYLSERCDVMAVGGAMAAYITGNVASNLLGRVLAVSASDMFGLSGSFLVFAGLNLMGAVLALVLIGPKDDAQRSPGHPPFEAWMSHLSRADLRSAFLIAFIILFVFVGVFTFVNLHLVDAFAIPPAYLGVVYLVFVPAMITTPLAGKVARRTGPQKTLVLALGATLLATPLTLVPSLPVVLAALSFIGASAFFAQAAGTGFVSQHAKEDQAAANGLYLSSYYTGGIFGALVVGQVFGGFGWTGVVVTVAVALAIALGLAAKLKAGEQTPQAQ